jgi:hypothetical protein
MHWLVEPHIGEEQCGFQRADHASLHFSLWNSSCRKKVIIITFLFSCPGLWESRSWVNGQNILPVVPNNWKQLKVFLKQLK